MAITFEQFFKSIAFQESNGQPDNGYGAVGPPVNGNRAYGKYQVMDFNIPSWTAKYYGKRLTPDQFSKSRAAQDAVARGVLKGYWDKYGARGAAAAWYSGNPKLESSTAPQPGGPSIKGYVDSVISRAGGMSDTPAATSVGSTPKDKLSSKELAEEYGFVESMLNANPELKKLFTDAVAKGWTKDMFQAKVRNTKWWKTHSEQERNYILSKYGDPATASKDYGQAFLKARLMGEQLGITYSKSRDKVATAAYNMIAKGWSDEQVRYYLGQFVIFDTKKGYAPGGEGQEAVDQMRGLAYNLGLTNSNDWYADRAREIIRGTTTAKDIERQMRQRAAAMFPMWSKQIKAGQNTGELAAPYMQSMTQILEIAPGSVNLFDPTIKKALTSRDSKGKPASVPLWQFENTLRQDPRWNKTQNAQAAVAANAHKVLQDMGMMF